MPQKKRRRKTGRFAPLVWIITAAVIAFFIGYSNKFRIAPFSRNISETNSQSAFNLTNFFTFPQTNHNSVSSTNKENSSSSSMSLSSISSVNKETNEAALVKVKIYLARKGENDITLVGKTIEIPKTQSLLRDTLQNLISYNDDKLLNMVPIHTKINKIRIKEGIALVDLSDDFSYNSSGEAGYRVQVYQIVYTATQFRNVRAVEFYIDGKPAEYLGGDGYHILNPVYPFSYLPKFPL